MDTTLVGVTLLSMAMAITLSVVVWRLLRDERRRSEARVAALADMAARATDHGSTRIAGRAADHHGSTPIGGDEQRSQPARTVDLPLRESPHQVPSGSLFGEADQSSPWGGRAVIMGGLALAGTAVVLFALTVRDRARVEPRVSVPPAQTTPATAATPPLELLSLRDSREANTLTITGLVQNPRGGAMLRKVAVTAFTFDRSGGFLGSGQALLDVTSLAPGDESPFVVAVPVSGAVARYRIGFRGEDGRVIAHIDKRQQGAVAGTMSSSVPGT